jgi:hypothetical protein
MKRLHGGFTIEQAPDQSVQQGAQAGPAVQQTQRRVRTDR